MKRMKLIKPMDKLNYLWKTTGRVSLADLFNAIGVVNYQGDYSDDFHSWYENSKGFVHIPGTPVNEFKKATIDFRMMGL